MINTRRLKTGHNRVQRWLLMMWGRYPSELNTADSWVGACRYNSVNCRGWREVTTDAKRCQLEQTHTVIDEKKQKNLFGNFVVQSGAKF